MGEMVPDESCGLSSAQVLPMPMGQTPIYPTAAVDKRSGLGKSLQSKKVLASWQLAERAWLRWTFPIQLYLSLAAFINFWTVRLK